MDKKNKFDGLGLTEFLDLHFNIFEIEDIEMIKDITRHLKKEFKSYFYDEFFRIAAPEVKKQIFSYLVESNANFNKERYAKHANENTFKTYNYILNRTKHANVEVSDIDGSTFEDLEKAIVDAGSPSLIIEFANNFECNLELMENTLIEQHPEVYHRAFRRLVLNDEKYHQDDMQMYL